MAAKFAHPVLIATLILAGATALTAEAQTSPPVAPGTPTDPRLLSTIFRCVRYSNGFATIAQRGDRTTPPLITWNYTLGQYTPQGRCNIVSQRLTQAVAENAGKLTNLQLLAGAVNHQAVICVVSNIQPACNMSNVLFTLRAENATRPDEVLATLHNFSVKGSGSPIPESDGLDPLPLEGLNQFLGPEAGADSGSNSPDSEPNNLYSKPGY
jgi:hypothetical protein